MSFIPVPNVAHFALNGTLNGEQVQNNLYFRSISGPWDAIGLEAMTENLRDWWDAQIRPWQGAGFSLRNIVGTSLESAIDAQFTLGTGLPLAGTRISATMPGNVSFCISFRTGFSGRSARGRNFFAGLVEDDVTGNTVASATVNAVVAAYGQLLNSIVVGTAVWVVVQRTENGVPLTEGVARNITSAISVDSNVDSMRRRLAGRGN